MHTKFSKLLGSFAGIFAIITTLLTGCGGDSGPQAVAKDIDAIALMEKLMSDDSKERFDALIALSEGKENAAPALDMILEVLTDDKDAKNREMAAYVLLEMGAKAAKPALPTLKEALEKEKNGNVKINIINAWNAIDPDSSPSTGANATRP